MFSSPAPASLVSRRRLVVGVHLEHLLDEGVPLVLQPDAGAVLAGVEPLPIRAVNRLRGRRPTAVQLRSPQEYTETYLHAETGTDAQKRIYKRKITNRR